MLTHSVQIVGYGTHKKLKPNGMFQNRKARIKQTPLVELCGPDDQDWKMISLFFTRTFKVESPCIWKITRMRVSIFLGLHYKDRWW